jgi:hypothetical protein
MIKMNKLGLKQYMAQTSIAPLDLDHLMFNLKGGI